VVDKVATQGERGCMYGEEERLKKAGHMCGTYHMCELYRSVKQDN
jgi:hypothetical protein